MDPQLLRVTIVGSVDDGKSTLIGRLLRDCGGIYDDQVEGVAKASRDGFDLAFITDGLQAEREQGITIDVAHRYFATEHRKFIVTDTPGHEQYTRNMATGASYAEVAIVLVDARKGPSPQTSRHVYIAWLLGIRHILVVVNKMDLVGFSLDSFRLVQHSFKPISDTLRNTSITFVPVVSLHGDNIVKHSNRMPWYEGNTVLEYLEGVPIDSTSDDQPLRMPVQYVIRSENNFRSYAGQIVSGSVAPGDRVLLLPSGNLAHVKSIPTYDGNLEKASAPMSAALCIEGEWDIGRGDMIADPKCPPHCAQSFSACLIWMSGTSLVQDRTYLIKHTSQSVCARVLEVEAKLDVSTLNQVPSHALHLNDIGMVRLETHRPLFFDPFSVNRKTGSFILIDPVSNLTVAAGMITAVCSAKPRLDSSEDGLTVLFTGLSSSGKTTLSREVCERLRGCGRRIELLDGDEVRNHLCRDLGFSKEDRDENIRRICFVAELLARNGIVVLVSAISPYRAVREEIRERIRNFAEVYVKASLEICERRDVKGLYRKARAGLIAGLTGVDDPYEPPTSAEVVCCTEHETLDESAAKVLDFIQARLDLRPICEEARA